MPTMCSRMNFLAATWRINWSLVKYRQTQKCSGERVLEILPNSPALYVRKLRHTKRNYLLKNIKSTCESRPSRFLGFRWAGCIYRVTVSPFQLGKSSTVTFSLGHTAQHTQLVN